MISVKFKQVYHGILNLMERNPATVTLTDSEKEDIITKINIRVREGWNYAPWPEAILVEERAFREGYQASVTYEAHREVWDEATETYYRSLQSGNTGNAVTNATWWEEITSLDAYLPSFPLDAYPIDTLFGMTKQHPWKNADSLYSYPFKAFKDGYWVLGTSIPDKVFAEFRLGCPRFTLTAYDAGTSYSLADIVYQPSTTGECYQAVLVNGVQTWNKIDFPAFLETFVKLAVYSDWLNDDGRNEKAAVKLDQAYRALENERIYKSEQQQQFMRYQGAS